MSRSDSGDDDELGRTALQELKHLLFVSACIIGGTVLILPATAGVGIGGFLAACYAAFRLGLRAKRAISIRAADAKLRIERGRARELARSALMLPAFPKRVKVIDAPEGGVRIETWLPLSAGDNGPLSLIFGTVCGEGTVFSGDPQLAFAVLEANLSHVAREGELVTIKERVLALESTAITAPEELELKAQALVLLAGRLDEPFWSAPRALARAVKEAPDPRAKLEALRRLAKRFPGSPELEGVLELARERFAEIAADPRADAGVRLQAIEYLAEQLDFTSLASVLDRVVASDPPPEIRKRALVLLAQLRGNDGGQLALVGDDERGRLALTAGTEGGLSEPQKE